jgi:drug/metabolite transporter (DMT)-like permease
MDAVGLFGIYYSLVYLSLSDAIVITFLVPTTTAIAGYLLLGESLSRREMLAGGAFLILHGPDPRLKPSSILLFRGCSNRPT